MFLDFNNETDQKKLDGLKYYNDNQICLGELLFQIYNSVVGFENNLPLKVKPKASWDKIPEHFKSEFEIISFSWAHGEMEGDRTLRFILKLNPVYYYEFLIEESSWEGPVYKGPTTVYPKQTTIYVKKEEF